MIWLARSALVVIAALAPSSAPLLSPPVTYFGMCDASAAVALGHDAFAVANDEDNFIRIYQRQPPALPLSTFDVSAFLNLSRGALEADLEGAARIGDIIYWIASHGRNASGQVSPNRHRFFATEVTHGERLSLRPIGQPYTRLLEDLSSDSRLREFALDQAAQLAPKQPGALNIEGLVATAAGQLLIGFRSPIPGGRALIVPLLNPSATIAGARAEFGDPIQLDLGGLGVRSLGWGNGRYFIIAGPVSDTGVSKLFEWPGPGSPPRLVDAINFTGTNPEGIAFDAAQGAQDIFVLSDDGALKIEGIGCKRMKDPAKRRFRAFQLLFQ
jgi:hypothetical protein